MQPGAVPFREALRAWTKVAALSFGGPAGQIAVMHRILVEQKRWIGENRFLHALNYCMLLPGPEAQQLATYIGWLLHGWAGGLVAGTLFILPGFLAILALSVLYAAYSGLPFVAALFFGLKPAVMAIVVEAVLRIGRRALRTRAHVVLAGAAFIAIFVFDLPFPLIVAGAALAGLLGGRWFGVHAGDADVGPSTRPPLRRTLGVLAGFSVLWLAPLAALGLWLGRTNVFVQEGVFFSTAAVVTFGGAYAVLAYVAQQAVETFGWLMPGEMLDGLGMAETTPGPLIQVVQFVGFMGAYRNPGSLDPVVAGTLGSVVTTWVTFVPCFLWIFLGAPYVEYLRGNRALANALSGITAAVVGVVLNLAVWFGVHTLFRDVGETRWSVLRVPWPDWGTIDLPAAVLAAGAFVAMLRFRVGMIATLGASVAAGAAWHLLARA